ncbi:hypothetical protein M5K25_023348 [Dendrobium thyrsiflorum]|uniref:Uncharacterized protein n=1 Tax=Dendrobium thyrsiflorum TaxID=117978 RepID=A0ABD0U7R1_DENTH
MLAEPTVPFFNALSNMQLIDPRPIPSSSFVQPTDPSPISPSQFESSQIVKAVEKEKSSYEVREQGGNSIGIRLSIRHEGSDTSRQELISHINGIFQLEEQLDQKRSEINKKEDSLLARTTKQSTLKGVNFNICEEGFESPIEIAKAYLASKPRKAAPYILNSQKNNASALSLQFGNRLARAQVAYRSGSCFPVNPVDSQRNKMAQESRGISTLYKLSRSPHCRSCMWAKIKGYSPKCERVKPCTITWTTSPSNFRHFGHGNALKRGSSDMDAGCACDARRVRQKFC